MPRDWVKEHLDGWDQPTLAAFVIRLKSSHFWPLNSDEMMVYLDALREKLHVERESKREAERRQQVDELDEVQGDFKEGLPIESEGPLDFLNRGKASFESDEYEAAIIHFDQAISIWVESDAGTESEELAEAYYLRGLVLSELEEKAEAVASYCEAIRFGYTFGSPPVEVFNDGIVRNPDLANVIALALFNRGMRHFKATLYDSAIRDFTHAISLNLNLGAAYFNRGNAWACTGKYETAANDYDAAVQIDPKYFTAFQNRSEKCTSTTGEHAVMEYEEWSRWSLRRVARGTRSCRKKHERASQWQENAIRAMEGD